MMRGKGEGEIITCDSVPLIHILPHYHHLNYQTKLPYSKYRLRRALLITDIFRHYKQEILYFRIFEVSLTSFGFKGLASIYSDWNEIVECV